MRYFLFSMAFLALSFTAPNVANAADASVAVVDVQSLLSDSKAAKNIQKQIQGYREKFLEELSKRETELREMDKALMKEKDKLSSEELAKRRQAFEKQFAETGAMAQKKRKELDRATFNAVGQLKESLFQVVQDIASEQGYELVISRQNVVVGAKSIDISDEAMARLNKKVSKIKLELED